MLIFFISATYVKLRMQGRASLCNLLAGYEGKINIDLLLLVSHFCEPVFLHCCLLSWYSSEMLCKMPINSLASSFSSRNCQAPSIFSKYIH